MLLPLPNLVNIPATAVGNTLLYNDTSVELSGDAGSGIILMRTSNKDAIKINQNQKIGINTNVPLTSQFLINSSSDPSVLKLTHQNNFPVDFSINPSNGNLTLTLEGEKMNINNSLDIVDHNKSTSKGLLLGGVLITASAGQINSLDTQQGTAVPSKALIVDANRDINNINILKSNQLYGTIQTSYQPNINSLDTLNIQNHNGLSSGLRLNDELVTVNATELNYNKINILGIAQPSKSLVVDSSLNISNINNLSCQQIFGSIRTANQSFITTVGTLSNLSVLGNVGIGYNGRNTFFKLEIKSVTGNCLKLTYDDGNNDKFTNISVNSEGALYIYSTDNNVYIQTDNNFHINTHDGTTGLWLNGTLVTSSAEQINYLNIATKGNAYASKALVLDQNKNISGINSIESTTIIGTLSTNFQPNITEVNRINIKLHNGSNNGLYLQDQLVVSTAEELNYVSVTQGTAGASKALVVDQNRNIGNINTITCSGLIGLIETNYQPSIKKVDFLDISLHNGSNNGLYLGSVLVNATATQLNYTSVIPGTGSSLKALVLDANRNIENINSLSANSLTGTIQTPNQPNISTVNTLNIQNHNGSNLGLSLGGVLVTSNALQINYLNITPGTTLPNKALILNASKSISGINDLSASTISGILTIPNQPNISSVNTLNIQNHNGSTDGLRLGGTLVTVTATEINYLDTLPGTAESNKAIILNNDKSTFGINELSCNTITGTILTPSQPNISSVNQLDITNHNNTNSGLRLSGELVRCSAEQLNRNTTILGTAEGGKNIALDSNKNVSGINTLSASYLSGVIQTPSQPNISSVNELNIQNHNGSSSGLSLNGILVMATATELNYLKSTVGNATALSALVVDTNKNITGINLLSATDLIGTIQTSSQPNITSVNTLNIQNHTGSSGLRLNGNLVIASADQLNATTALPGNATPQKALITNSVNSIAGINTISSTKVVTESIEINGVLKNINTGGLLSRTFSSVDFIGRVVDLQILSLSSFSNISPGGLSNNYSMEIIGYIYPQYSETYTFFVQCQDRVRLWVNNRMILCSWTYVASARMSSTIFLNANTWYPIYAQYQVDSNSSLFLLEWTSSNTPRGSIPPNRMAWDNMDPNHNINHHVQNSLVVYNSSTATLNQTTFTVDNSGDLLIDSSGNDIRFGLNDNINIQSHNGTTSGLFLGGQLVEPTAFELNYLKVSPGQATATHALVVDGTTSITGLTSLTAQSLSCTNLTASDFTISDLTLNGPLSNFNTGGLVIKQITGPDLSGRVVDVSLTTSLAITDYDPRGLNGTFSLEISGYILPQFSENYIFHIIANDRARVWINNKLVLNIWDTFTGIEYSSTPVALTMNQWAKIHIQFQNISGSSSIQLKWSSPSTSKNLINSSYMAWDNRDSNVSNKLTVLDTLTLVPSSPIIGIQSGTLTIDSSGSLTIASSGNIISINDQNSLNISGHNSTTRGLMLNGSLVTASATELNYLSNSVFGVAGGGKVMILDNNRSITNINSLSATTLTGTLSAGPQPNITSIGTMTSTFSVASDIVVGDLGTGTNGRIRLASSGGVSYIQSGVNDTSNSSNDLMIGNINANTTTSSRKFMIKGSGFTGIQTILPNRTLTVNGAGESYSLRLVHNNNNGTESGSGFVDMGSDSLGNLIISPTGSSCNILSGLRIGSDLSNALFTMNGTSLKITSTSGSIQVGNTSSSNLPLEIGSVNFSISSGTYGFVNSTGSVGIKTDNTINSFSLRTTGRVIVGGEVDIISDRRSKKDIKILESNHCKKFIDEINPVSFIYKNTPEEKIHYGFVAQDVYKAGFENLVSVVPDDNVKEEIDEDGFVHPDKKKFVLCYDEIIPILTSNIKNLYDENKQLKETVSSLIDEIKWIKSKLI